MADELRPDWQQEPIFVRSRMRFEVGGTVFSVVVRPCKEYTAWCDERLGEIGIASDARPDRIETHLRHEFCHQWLWYVPKPEPWDEEAIVRLFELIATDFQKQLNAQGGVESLLAEIRAASVAGDCPAIQASHETPGGKASTHQADRLLPLEEVCYRYSCSRRSILLYEKSGQIPKSVKFAGKRRKFWRESEIAAHIRSLKSA